MYGLLLAAYNKWIRKSQPVKIRIDNAKYGAGSNFIDVIDKVKKQIEEQHGKRRVRFKADDEILLEPGKPDDPVPGTPKKFKIGYWYLIEKEYSQGETVYIPHQEPFKEISGLSKAIKERAR